MTLLLYWTHYIQEIYKFFIRNEIKYRDIFLHNISTLKNYIKNLDKSNITISSYHTCHHNHHHYRSQHFRLIKFCVFHVQTTKKKTEQIPMQEKKAQRKIVKLCDLHNELLRKKGSNVSCTTYIWKDINPRIMLNGLFLFYVYVFLYTKYFSKHHGLLWIYICVFVHLCVYILIVKQLLIQFKYYIL